jgi:hypothetical protein
MILYANDWQRFPTAIPDYNTSNKSFLHLARLYHEMGVQNCLFPLALYNPELVGVDPYSTTLTLQQKADIGAECRWNIWYYLREVVRIPPNASNEPIKFIANRGNIATFWAFFNNIDAALIQPRQTGKSTSTDTMMIWLLYIGADNSRIALFTLNDKLRKENINRLKRIRDLLPKYLVHLSPNDADNKFELSCEERGNRYIANVGQNSEAAANAQGRGFTAPVMQFDEPPFTPFIGDSIPAALAAGVAVRREAERNNRPYGNIFTTTAGKKDDRDGKYIYDMIQDGAPWSEMFLDATDKADLSNLIKLNGGRKKDPNDPGSLLLNITMSHRQLGYTDEWLAETIAIAKATGEKADRDFFNRWTAGSQQSPLSVALNEIIRSGEREVLWTERSKDNYLFRWYIKKEEHAERMANGHFVFGLDTSDAGPGDGVALVLVDARDMSVVGAGTYTETNLIRLSNYFADLLVKYENTTLIIERKSSGQSIIDNLLMVLPKYGLDPFKRMFNKIVDEKDQRQEEWKEIKRSVSYRSDRFYDGFKTAFGFFTDKNTRPLITEVVLQNSAKQVGHLIRDKSLINEILGLVVKNGRVDHQSGGHDDHVIAWLMTHWLLTHGRHLDEYGIPANYALQGVTENGKEATEEQIEGRRVQEEVMIQIDMVTAELERCQDEILVYKLEHRLKTLISRLSFEDRELYSVDALMRVSAEERKKRQLTTVKAYRPMERTISLQQRPSMQSSMQYVRSNGSYFN